MATYASLKYDFGTQITGAIPEGAIADNAITLAKMASGTDGNIITYDASGNPAYVVTGSDGQVLTSAGAGAAPVMEAVAAGGGKILQVIQHELASNYSMSASATTDVTGMSKAITMASTSNKLLVLGSYNLRFGGNGATVAPGTNIFMTDASNNYLAGNYFILYLLSTNNNMNLTWEMSQIAFFTPGTTSAYTIKLRCNNASEGGFVQFYGSTSVHYSRFLLMEIEV